MSDHWVMSQQQSDGQSAPQFEPDRLEKNEKVTAIAVVGASWEFGNSGSIQCHTVLQHCNEPSGNPTSFLPAGCHTGAAAVSGTALNLHISDRASNLTASQHPPFRCEVDQMDLDCHWVPMQEEMWETDTPIDEPPLVWSHFDTPLSDEWSN